MRPTDALLHPPDWHKTSVGLSTEIKRGVSWNKEQEHPKPGAGRIPVIRIGNVQERLLLDDLVYLSGLKPAEIEKKRVSAKWSIMVGSNGNRNRVGNAVLIRENSDFLFASFLLAVKPFKESGICPEFFFRWLSSEQVQAYLSASSEGSTGLNNLSHSFFKAITIAFPAPSEQAAIARILDAVDSVIERTRKTMERAQEAKRSLVQRLFAEGTRQEIQRKTRIGFIPHSWNVVEVNSVVFSFQYGLSVPMQAKGVLPILRMGNIQNGDVTLEDLKYISLPEKVVSSYVARRGDVFFNRTNSQEHVGKVGIYRSNERAVFASYLIRVIPNPEKVDNYFLGQLLGSYAAQCRIKRYATPGVQQVNINATNLGKVLIPIPLGKKGLDEQREMASILEKADEAVRAHIPMLIAQQKLKKSLMHDLLTGSVRVNNLRLESIVNQ